MKFGMRGPYKKKKLSRKCQFRKNWLSDSHVTVPYGRKCICACNFHVYWLILLKFGIWNLPVTSLSKYTACENWCTEKCNHTLLHSVNKFLSAFCTFIFWLEWNLSFVKLGAGKVIPYRQMKLHSDVYHETVHSFKSIVRFSKVWTLCHKFHH